MTATMLKGLAAIPIAEVHPSPNNPRDHLADIEDLAASIREVGLIQPVVVQQVPGQPGYQVVAGHRRRAALLLLGWPSVPCIIRRDMLPDEELLAMLVENGQRSGLDPIEEARAMRRLVQSGLPEAEVARSVGRSLSWVRGRLALLGLPDAEQEAIRAGHYTLQHATRLIRNERAEERKRFRPTARPIGRPKGAKTKPYFGDTHPLAKTARSHCADNGHGKGHVKVGGVACGPCWEHVIRGEERGA